MHRNDCTELALRKWPVIRGQVYLKRDYSLRPRELAQKVKIFVEANEGAPNSAR
jgi:hypothetical protein